MGLFTSGLGAHLTWTLPFGLLIMFAVFNRFDHRLEEAARDLGRNALANLLACGAAHHPAQSSSALACSASPSRGMNWPAQARQSAL